LENKYKVQRTINKNIYLTQENETKSI
jgi:hypothetical protein